MRNLISLLCGGLFGLGLVVSGMTDTTKVQGFLDILGAWDPTLMFVMGGAIVPMFFAWRYADGHKTGWLGSALPKEMPVHIDRPLILGAVLFGMGWALSGFCPGPAMASLSFGGWSGVTFLGAMCFGMIAAKPIKTIL